MVLAHLAAIDPGGRLVNRPANSLAEIFVLWNPNTNTSSAQRLAALDEIIKAFPDVGWDLILKLLPFDAWRLQSDGKATAPRGGPSRSSGNHLQRAVGQSGGRFGASDCSCRARSEPLDGPHSEYCVVLAAGERPGRNRT
jgi:hypothetical protein